jgi:hypothetical protein
MNNNELLRSLLVESGVLTEAELNAMSPDYKAQSIKELAYSILRSVSDRLKSLDTAPIDRSRGDIKQLKELNSLQGAITQLEAIIERASESVDTELVSYLREIIKSIMFLNQFSAQFKEAYRDRKVLLMLRYQSMVMSIFSSVSYLISVMIDFSTGNVELVKSPKYEEIAPIKAIKDFNRSVETGGFRSLLKDSEGLRGQLNESQQEINENKGIIDFVIDKLEEYTGPGVGNKLVSFLYKASGIIAFLLSLREIFYMLFRARTKFNEILNSVEAFANVSTSGASGLTRLSSFADKFSVDAEESTKLAAREIEGENRDIANEVRSMVSGERQPQAAEVASDEKKEAPAGFLDF